MRTTIACATTGSAPTWRPPAASSTWPTAAPSAPSQTSPKLGVVFGPFGPHARTELYANWGNGFHSNDVRGATSVMNPADGSATDKLGLFAKARGAEAGIRTTVLPGWSSSLSLWRMKLGSELVFIGDEGVTEARGASTRHGLEWSNYYAPNSWLIIDGDVAWSKARFTAPADNGGSEIPNAIPLTASLGIGVDPGGPWFGGLRMRYLGAYALEETGVQKSTPVLYRQPESRATGSRPRSSSASTS
ncbi:TonB-dependent receptor [Massilia sp. H-1]|nr:TonB-dependent receptor [Massilia sp. H-1]